MIKITVFTPVYNRAYIIGNLYQSLLRQTVKDFEWVIVNDGSTDNIDELVNGWLKADNGFQINYITVKNQGKHAAINRGVQAARGWLFFIVDSDDYLIDNAIEIILDREKSVPKGFAGLAFNRGYNNQIVIGKTFSGDYVDATSLERRKHKILGDKAEVFYTDILKKYPFPVFEGEKFVTEATVWYKIANDGYKIRWFNEIIYICNYLPDGLTASRDLVVKNFKGFTHSTREIVLYPLPFIDKLKYISNYIWAAKKNKLSFKEAARRINVSTLLLFAAFTAYAFNGVRIKSIAAIKSFLRKRA